MYCCPECFDDVDLRTKTVSELSDKIGDCTNCGSSSQPLAHVRRLSNYFEVLISIYVPSDEGKSLVQWLQDDWSVFNEKKITQLAAQSILSEILDDGDIVRKTFELSEKCQSDSEAKWEELKTELMHENRFFPETDFRMERLTTILPYLVLEDEKLPQQWFRARIEDDRTPYPLDRMGLPPRHKASHGRVNPAGIPYLYLASRLETATAEVRPHPGDRVCIAEFSSDSSLKLIDLRAPKNPYHHSN